MSDDDNESNHDGVSDHNITTEANCDNEMQCTPRPISYNKALFILKAKEERRITQRAIDGLICDISILFEEELSKIKTDIISCVQENCGTDDTVSKIDNIIAHATISPFHGLDSAYLQRLYFLDHFHLLVSIAVLCLTLLSKSQLPSLCCSFSRNVSQKSPVYCPLLKSKEWLGT